jgi:3-hydroxypropanoate dehydrogenase
MKISQDALDQLFFKARTANGFLDTPVPAAVLQEVYAIASMGATSMNTQPTRYVFLNSTEARARLLPALLPGNLDKTRTAPVTVIVATDTRFYEHMPQVWHKPGAQEMFAGNAALSQGTATRNGTLGGAYFMIAGPGLRPHERGRPGQGQCRILPRWPLAGQLPDQPGLWRRQALV